MSTHPQPGHHDPVFASHRMSGLDSQSHPARPTLQILTDRPKDVSAVTHRFNLSPFSTHHTSQWYEVGPSTMASYVVYKISDDILRTEEPCSLGDIGRDGIAVYLRDPVHGGGGAADRVVPQTPDTDVDVEVND